MFSFPASRFGVDSLNSSRQRASFRVGSVLVRLILLKLGRALTRLVGLRAANVNLPVVILLVPVFYRRLFFFCSSSFGFPRVTAELSIGPARCFVFSCLLSLPLAGR